jgi:signal transduction histidine kinase
MKTREQFQDGGDPIVPAGPSRAVTVASATTGTTIGVSTEAASRTLADCEDRLHAVRSALAGVSGALHLLTDRRDDLPETSRLRLESLLVGEVERLRRLLAPPANGEAPATVEVVDLDALVGNVVLGRRTCGQDVAWTPSGCRVRARADDLVETLNILLVNAWRHAQGAPARIEVAREGASVLVHVSDDGPGVLPELGERIFERAVRRPGSRGQGLGLAMARDLVESVGGSLTLTSPGPAGARFCLALPAAVEHEGAA